MKKKVDNKVTHSAVYCLDCGTIIYSRTRHDFRFCKCKKVAVDGGFDYLKVSFDKEDRMIVFPFILPKNITTETLYKDWNETLEKEGYYESGNCPVYIKKGLLKKTNELFVIKEEK